MKLMHIMIFYYYLLYLDIQPHCFNTKFFNKKDFENKQFLTLI